MPRKLSKQELNDALKKISMEETVLLNTSDSDDSLDVLAKAFFEDPMFCWVAELEDRDPNKAEMQYELNKYMHAWVNHRLINGSRGRAVGIRDAENELVGCMTVAPSCCAKERLLDTLVNIVKLGSPPMAKHKGKYGPHSQKRLESLSIVDKARAKHMKGEGRWIYLQSIGVRPSEHGKGHGKKMLQLLCKTADSLHASIYLETESTALQSMYQHFGFDTLEELAITAPNDNSSTARFTMYLMERKQVGSTPE